MELITVFISCLVLYASWAAILSNSFFHRTWSLALLPLPFLFRSFWFQSLSALALLCIVLFIIDVAVCVALSPLWLFFRTQDVTQRHKALGILHDESDAVADIVAVHGLASRPNETWRARPTQSLNDSNFSKDDAAPAPAPIWLSDFLPKEGLKCRILTFNHNTAWETNSLSKSLEDHGRDLLRALGRHRGEEEVPRPSCIAMLQRTPVNAAMGIQEKQRPIIFIGHSFGGIIIKEAVVIGHQYPDNDYRGNIGRCAQGFIFLGTPHEGSSLTIAGKILTLFNHWTGSSTSLLEVTEHGSETNRRLHTDFLSCYKLETIVCFFEAVRETLWGIPLMHTVPKTSAEIAGAENIGSERQHRDLQRFSSMDDNEYQDLVFSLKNLLKRASATPLGTSWASHLQKAMTELTRFPKSVLGYYTLKFGAELAIDPDSMEWFMKSVEVDSWLSSHETQFLWHSGARGSGKTKSSWYIVRHYLEQRAAFQPRLVYYFHPENDEAPDATNRPHNPTSYHITLSIIAQLLSGNDDLVQHIPPDVQHQLLACCQTTDPSQEEVLWRTIRVLVKNMTESNLIVIVDGVDRLPSDQRAYFLQSIRDLWIAEKSRSTLKVLISSRPYSDIRNIIGDLPSIDPEKELTDCLNSLLSHSQNKRRTAIEPGVPQTGDWLWSDTAYREWNDSPKSTLLWIQGKPGSGKSTLCKKILGKLLGQHDLKLTELYNSMDHTTSSTRRSAERRKQLRQETADQPMRDPVAISTFFYSFRGEQTEASHVQMLHSLMYQILWQERRLYPIFRDKYRELRSTSRGQATGAQWTFAELRDILVSLAEFNGFSVTIYLLIDAMDESHRTQERDQVLSLLRDLHFKSSQCVIKTVLASRPDNDIRGKLAGFPHITLEYKNRDDVEKVIDRKMDGLRQAYVLGGEEESSSEEIETMLEDVKGHLAYNAQGVFLWVEMVSRELNELFKRGITPRDLEHILTNLPDELEKLYQRIVTRLKAENLTFIAEARRMFTWATFALRPLTVEEFRDAIAIPVSTSNDLKVDREKERLSRMEDVRLRLANNCGDLLQIKPKHSWSSRAQANDTVQLLHRTVREFFLDPDKAAHPFNMEESQGSCDIALVCIRYLKMSMETPVVKPVPEWSDNNYDDFVKHMSCWPLLPYVIRFLPRHLELTETHLSRAENFVAGFVDHIERDAGHPALRLLETWLKNLGFPDRHYPDNQEAVMFRARCLDIAASSGNLNVTMIVLDAESLENHTEESSFGRTLYMTSLRGHANIVQLLLDKGADINAKGGDHGSALQAASSSGELDVVQLLLANGADVNGPGGEDVNALQAAVIGGHPNVIQLLLDHGADVSAPSKKYVNALQAAAYEGRVDMVELLVENGADISSHGRDALLTASDLGHLEIVELLLQLGVVANGEEGEFYDNLVDVAVAGGHTEVSQFLLAKRASLRFCKIKSVK